MKKLISLIFISSVLTGCEYIGNNPNGIKTINREIDSLTRVRDSLLVEEKKLDSPVLFVYYYRELINEENSGIFWSSQIYHSGDLLKGPFDKEDSLHPQTIVEVLSEGKRVKDLKR